MPSELDSSSQRQALQELMGRIQEAPFTYLPERSVECLYKFFDGYAMFGSPVSDELAHFGMWLVSRREYHKDVGSAGRFIRLNSGDGYDSYQNFFKWYQEYSQSTPEGPQLADRKYKIDPGQFDFYGFLYGIRHRTGMYLGQDDLGQMAAFISGYFKGKEDAGLELNSDEKQFLAFESWLIHHHQVEQTYPWYRLFLLWPWRARIGSVESFFGAYDDYLTDFRKRPGALDEMFEVVKLEHGSKIQRRKIK